LTTTSAGIAAAAQGSTPVRPNILWIQTDEQRPDSLGCYGSKWARTPNIDRLAAQGTTYHQCHVQSPVCVPSRTSMLSCRYPQEVGIYDNTHAFKDGFLDPNLKMFPNLFADAGYRTASIGKWHTPNHPTWQDNREFVLFNKVANPYRFGPGFSEPEHRVIKNDGQLFSCILSGIYPQHDWGTSPSSHVTDVAVAWLQEAARSRQPWLLRVSHVWPHTPVLVPRPWDKVFAPGDTPCHALNHKMYDGRASYDRWFADGQGGMKLSMDQWRQLAADYYSLCAFVDHEVGRLLHTLEALGMASNTIVAFNSDHGRSMGEIGLTQKGTYDYEVWRVPFILSWPKHIAQGEHKNDLCELIDFGPTLCALAGIAKATGMHGRDLLHSQPPDAVYGIIQTNDYRRAAIRTAKHRFDCTIKYKDKPVGWEECDANLTDVDNDPAEERNLFRDPGMRRLAGELHHRVMKWIEDPGSAYVG
jgi:choline-sulfatase